MSRGNQILDHLNAVAAEREARSAEPELNAKVQAIKGYQQLRFRHTYADLLTSARYGPAAHFFLDELYGPTDFSRRDAEFARVVPTMIRLFPTEIVETVAALAELHALSERLDTTMGRELQQIPVTAVDYVQAWQATGNFPARTTQIELTLGVARALESVTRRTLLRNSLRVMRRPARAAGLGELQRFLESGFDTFKAMNGARDFIAVVGARERALAAELFGAKLRKTGALTKLDGVFELLP